MIMLEKGQKTELTKGNEGLNKILVGLGWDVNKFNSCAFDLDSSVFLLDENGKCKSEKDFIYFGRLNHDSGSVKHTGDNLTGAGDGDDEQIKIDLSKIPESVTKIVFAVNIYQASARNQNFGMVNNSFIRLVDEAKNVELIRYDLGEDYSTETSVIVGEIYRHNGEWKFSAVGSGHVGGTQALCSTYGL